MFGTFDCYLTIVHVTECPLLFFFVCLLVRNDQTLLRSTAHSIPLEEMEAEEGGDAAIQTPVEEEA